MADYLIFTLGFGNYKEDIQLVEEKQEIERNLMRLSPQVLNLDNSVGFAIKIAAELPSKWVSADYSTKKCIQFMLFLKRINDSKKTDECRTQRIIVVFIYVAYFKRLTTNKKEVYQNSHWVVPHLLL